MNMITMPYSWAVAYECFANSIDAIPEADVEPVRHGRWEKSNIPHEKYCCSVCGGACWYYDYAADVARSRFCPNCGAKMDGKEKKA